MLVCRLLDQVAIRDICEKDPERLGNRGSHRYSFAGAHKQSIVEFSVMADSRPVLEVLTEIFQSPDFTCDGVGGDFVLPVRYNTLPIELAFWFGSMGVHANLTWLRAWLMYRAACNTSTCIGTCVTILQIRVGISRF